MIFFIFFAIDLKKNSVCAIISNVKPNLRSITVEKICTQEEFDGKIKRVLISKEEIDHERFKKIL